ncbi:LuxR family transcriptional regulator [Rhizocola hellebori]|uniref:LuxR family transcriptional regulator n=1 Tax=Rhizocola hellebori TaxID=1392758 RepID=A0A8J3VDM1_9ACTN|nr:LuxR C-terminal-related transcriptional regulator [Rhizocola hellebori]GIH02845.1 LuxR family transcriptional regulator [Rhizocola hellebori]
MHDTQLKDRPILLSKLLVPQPPEDMIVRQRLVARVALGTERPVTALVAPAGWGKTALLADWARRDGSVRPLAWLSLEPGDDGRFFWSCLCRALSIASMPEPPTTDGQPEHDQFLIMLADTLSRLAEPVVLVLDDAQHLRNQEVWRGLEFLLRHAAGMLRLVVATRERPQLLLYRWRLAGDLTEIDAGELAFKLTETQQLLARMGCDLPADAVVALHERAEGWAAGIRLGAAAEDGDIDDAVQFIEQEVIAALPPELAEILCMASIGDYLSGELVDALTLGDRGVALLEHLERAGMFVVRMVNQPWTHRFHRMFAELLRARLMGEASEQIPELHRRAARWHLTHDLPAQALHHALSGDDDDLAVSILYAHWPQLVLPGHQCVPAAWPAQTAPNKVDSADPMLALAFAAGHLQSYDINGVSRCLRVAERLHENRSQRQEQSNFPLIATSFRLAIAQAHGDVAAADVAASQALALDLDHDGAGRASILTMQGEAQLVGGVTSRALQTLQRAVDEADSSSAGCLRLAASSTLALAQASDGQLYAAQTTAQRALDMPACPGQAGHAHRAPALLALATVQLQRGEPGDAQRYLRAAAKACEARNQPALVISIERTLAQSLADQGDLVGASKALLDGRRSLQRADFGSDPMACELAVAQADLHTIHGDADTAITLLCSLPGDRPPPVAVGLAKAHLRGGDAGEAMRALPPWEQAEDLTTPLRLEAGMVQALAAHRLGERHCATRTLEVVLGLAETEGFRRVFVGAGRAGQRVLAEHLDSGTAHWPLVQTLLADQPALPHDGFPAEPLSPRELTVLRYLQGVLSNPEIASELCLSVNTIKTHVRSVYRKLQATSRRDAVRRARDMQLL